jgi:hypothetical protein
VLGAGSYLNARGVRGKVVMEKKNGRGWVEERCVSRGRGL